MRHKSGSLGIGGEHPVSVQSMIKLPTENVSAVLGQIEELEKAGCEIVRLAVNTKKAAEVLTQIVSASNLPLVADIHFDHELAIMSMEAGVSKVRVNPGNIGDENKLAKVVDCARSHKVPIRIGVNAGSLEKTVLKKYTYPCADAMVESAMLNIQALEKMKFEEIIVSMKSSDVPMTIEAYRKLSGKVNYPLHLGITESGSGLQGLTKSILGIGTLLAEGIGDTIRVSLTDSSVKEVEAGREILRSLGLKQYGATVISCPTCGRAEASVAEYAEKVKDMFAGLKDPVRIAVMGCVVNGPGESKEADVGVCLGAQHSVLYSGGKSLGMISNSEVLDKIKHEINNLVKK